MKLIYGNLWDQQADAICITTNGFIKSNGECVMGRGCALEAAKRFKQLPSLLANAIKKRGNVVNPLGKFMNQGSSTVILSFPVKPDVKVTQDSTQIVAHMRDKLRPNAEGDYQIPGWACKASLDIIEQSCKQLVHVADTLNFKKVIVPRPGVGFGELQWGNVEPILSKYLDDRFHVITHLREPHEQV